MKIFTFVRVLNILLKNNKNNFFKKNYKNNNSLIIKLNLKYNNLI
jgi:hypothetical protein